MREDRKASERGVKVDRRRERVDGGNYDASEQRINNNHTKILQVKNYSSIPSLPEANNTKSKSL